MKNFFGTRTWNSMKTLGLLKNIIAMISVQYLACLLRISNAFGGKPMHYIIEKSSIHCAPTGTVVCTRFKVEIRHFKNGGDWVIGYIPLYRHGGSILGYDIEIY